MATSQEKKRKSRSEERHESRKKRKEDGASRSKSRRTKSSRSGHSSSAAGKKVRSISELVKLVISGEVKVPKSLRQYVGDRHSLLDQVFTILSESDVRGMLPDILKGLKVKQVKQLCLDQLKGMSTEDILDTLDPQSAVKRINLDATVFELLGPGTAGSNMEEDALSATNVDTSTRTSSAASISGGDDLREGSSKTGICAAKGEKIGRGRRNIDKMERDSSVSIRESTSSSKVEDSLHLSDVSGDEGNANSSVHYREEVTRTSSSPLLTMECDTTTTELSVEHRTTRELEGDSDDESVSTSSDSSLSDLDDCWLSEFPEEVPEWARLQEVEFRRRALEAELRRRGDQVEEGRGEEGRREERGSVGREGEGDEEDPVPGPVKVDKSEAIELQLRQRALQSLLAKRKEQEL